MNDIQTRKKHSPQLVNMRELKKQDISMDKMYIVRDNEPRYYTLLVIEMQLSVVFASVHVFVEGILGRFVPTGTYMLTAR